MCPPAAPFTSVCGSCTDVVGTPITTVESGHVTVVINGSRTVFDGASSLRAPAQSRGDVAPVDDERGTRHERRFLGGEK